MSFRHIGQNGDIEDFKRERRNDVATVDNLIENRVVGRNRTGFRPVPSDSGDTTAGDRVGDYIYDLSGNRRYELIQNGVNIQWVYFSIVSSF